MLTPMEIAALVTATKGAVDLFDKFGSQIKSVLLNHSKAAEGEDERWKIKIGTEGDNIVVKEQTRTVQTITGDALGKKLNPRDLQLVQAYEQKMDEYFDQWRVVYAEKDSSADPLVNAKTDMQLKRLIKKMQGELLGILGFLQGIGVQLDDHYAHIRGLVADVK